VHGKGLMKSGWDTWASTIPNELQEFREPEGTPKIKNTEIRKYRGPSEMLRAARGCISTKVGGKPLSQNGASASKGLS